MKTDSFKLHLPVKYLSISVCKYLDLWFTSQGQLAPMGQLCFLTFLNFPGGCCELNLSKAANALTDNKRPFTNFISLFYLLFPIE